MQKRFFHPVWKLDELENLLSKMEENGWRLQRIYGLRRFEFVKSSPKTVNYFFTHSMVREKSNMNIIEHSLLHKFKANKIQGDFAEGLGVTSVYRITEESNLNVQRLHRHIILQHYLMKNTIYSFIYFIIVTIPIIAGIFLNSESLCNDLNVFSIIVIILNYIITIAYMIFNLVGFVHMRKKCPMDHRCL